MLLLLAQLSVAGLPYTEPFPITQEYRADYSASELCALHPKEYDAVKEGDLAVYAVKGKKVMVLLDETGRRFALDYCWQ